MSRGHLESLGKTLEKNPRKRNLCQYYFPDQEKLWLWKYVTLWLSLSLFIWSVSEQWLPFPSNCTARAVEGACLLYRHFKTTGFEKDQCFYVWCKRVDHKEIWKHYPPAQHKSQLKSQLKMSHLHMKLVSAVTFNPQRHFRSFFFFWGSLTHSSGCLAVYARKPVDLDTGVRSQADGTDWLGVIAVF